MRPEKRLAELESEIDSIRRDAIGLSATRLRGKKATTFKTGHLLYQK